VRSGGLKSAQPMSADSEQAYKIDSLSCQTRLPLVRIPWKPRMSSHASPIRCGAKVATPWRQA
jgi:hypothetical protein